MGRPGPREGTPGAAGKVSKVCVTTWVQVQECGCGRIRIIRAPRVSVQVAGVVCEQPQ